MQGWRIAGERSSGGHENILVIVDHIIPLEINQLVQAADGLYSDFMLRFGFPARILHDQGREFEEKLFRRLQWSCKLKSFRTTLPSAG